MQTKRIWLVALLALLATFCVAVPVSAEAEANATVTVAHFAPFAKTVDSTSVTVRINGEDKLTNFKFGDVVKNLPLPAGTYTIEILPTGTSTAAIKGKVKVNSGVDYTLAAIGNGSSQPLELLAFVDFNAPMGHMAKLRVAHLAPFAADLSATKVDICTDSGAIVPGLAGIPYKGYTNPFLPLPPGEYNLKITIAGSNCATVALDLPSVTLAKGDVVEIYAIGDISNVPLQLGATTDVRITPPAKPATVTVAHYAPFANSVDETSVTVRVNGKDTFKDFKFGDIQKNVELPAGKYKIEILPTGSDKVAITGEFELAAGVDYTLSAIGNGSKQPLELFALVDDNGTDPEKAKIRISHLAPFDADLNKTKVDICTDAGAVVVPGVPYKVATQPYLSLPAGDYNLKVALAGTNCAEIALDLPSVRLNKGTLTEVYAIGDIANLPLQLSATTDIVPTPGKSATVTIAHFAPFAKNVDETAVTVRINGEDKLFNVKFGDIEKNVELPAGNYLVEIVPNGSESAAISGTFNLEAGVDYTVAAIGNGSKQPLELYPLLDNNTPLSDSAKIRIAHLAPFADTLDGSKVDICTDGGTAVPGLTGVPYKAATGYLPLPAGDYDLQITLAGSDCKGVAIDIAPFRLANSDVVELYAIGDIETQELNVVATSDWDIQPEEKPATVTVAHFAPFAATKNGTSVTVRINGSDVITGFRFPDIAKNVPLTAGKYLVEILPTGTSTVAISKEFTLAPGVDYTVAAIGNGSKQPLELFAFVDDNTPDKDNAKVRIAHLAPFADTLDGTKVDICTDAGQVVPGLVGIPYKGFTDPYLALPEGDYNLKVTIAGSNCNNVALDLPSLRLAKGTITELYAIGDIDNQGLRLAHTTSLALTPDQSTVTIQVKATPGSIRNFRFFSAFGQFRLDDAQPQDGDSFENSISFTVMPGTYNVSEAVPYRWYLTGLTCQGGNTKVDLAINSVGITVGKGETVTCIFENSRHAFIRTQVYDDQNGNGSRDFEPSLKDWGITLYDANGKRVQYLLTNDNGKANFNHLRPGNYSVCQSTQTGWTNTQPAVTNPAFANQPCYDFTADPKETVTLLFGNINQVGFVSAAGVDAAIGGKVEAEDMYPDHDNGNYFLEGDFIDEDAATPPLTGKVFMPLVAR